MSDIDKFLMDNPDFVGAVISAVKEALETYPDKEENINFALECVKAVVDSEQEHYIVPTDSTNVAEYIK